MADETKEKSIPVEEMVGGDSPEIVKKIAQRIKDLKETAFEAATTTFMSLILTGAGGLNVAAAFPGKSDTEFFAGSGMIAGGVLMGFISHHVRTTRQGEANALTGALAKHLLESVEKTQTAAPSEPQP